jgi:hypothetical protein
MGKHRFGPGDFSGGCSALGRRFILNSALTSNTTPMPNLTKSNAPSAWTAKYRRRATAAPAADPALPVTPSDAKVDEPTVEEIPTLVEGMIVFCRFVPYS